MEGTLSNKTFLSPMSQMISMQSESMALNSKMPLIESVKLVVDCKIFCINFLVDETDKTQKEYENFPCSKQNECLMLGLQNIFILLQDRANSLHPHEQQDMSYRKVVQTLPAF